MVTRLEANGMEMPPERAVTFASFIKSLMAAATTSGASFTDFPIGCLPYGPSAISPYVSRIAAPRDARSCTIFIDDAPMSIPRTESPAPLPDRDLKISPKENAILELYHARITADRSSRRE